MPDLAAVFLARSRAYLRGDYLPKLERCLDALSEDDVWWRPNDASNSVGNLLLHLAGNARQWIVAGVGGAEDTRARPEEFAASGPLPKADLLVRLRDTLDAADAVLAGLDGADLLAQRRIQGHDVTVLEAVYHVVEHFSTHTGQVVYVTKLRTGRDLAFYAAEGNLARLRWEPTPGGPV